MSDKNPPWNYNYENGHPAIHKSLRDITDLDRKKINCKLCNAPTDKSNFFYCLQCFFRCNHCRKYFDLRFFDPVDCLSEDETRYFSICHFCWDKLYPLEIKEPECS